MKLLQLLQSEFTISTESPTGLIRRGKPAGWNNGRYWRTKVNGKGTMCHVIIMILHTKDETLSGLEVDHIDRDGFNNKLENLRLVTRGENVVNTKYRTDSKTGVKGVSYRHGRKKPYCAHKQRDGRRVCKSFSTLQEAINWYAKEI